MLHNLNYQLADHRNNLACWARMLAAVGLNKKVECLRLIGDILPPTQPLVDCLNTKRKSLKLLDLRANLLRTEPTHEELRNHAESIADGVKLLKQLEHLTVRYDYADFVFLFLSRVVGAGPLLNLDHLELSQVPGENKDEVA